jgi:hypothetical protein
MFRPSWLVAPYVARHGWCSSGRIPRDTPRRLGQDDPRRALLDLAQQSGEGLALAGIRMEKHRETAARCFTCGRLVIVPPLTADAGVAA